MTEPAFSPGDFVVCGTETALVWSVEPSALIVLPAKDARGALKTSDVDLGALPLSTIKGPTLVTINRKAFWRASNCIRIGHLTAEQQNAVRFAIKRTEDNRRAEASVTTSAIFTACKPSFRSGGRRVGGARAAA